MKVIAEIPGDKVLVELSKDEFANVCGHYSKYSKGFDIKDTVGEDIEISDIYHKHRQIHRIQNSHEYEKARSKLQDMLNALIPIEDKIQKIKIEKLNEK